jgi:hypothetical protein
MKPPLPYRYVYCMLKKELKGSNIIHISKIYPIVRWWIRLPRKYNLEIIKEMEEYGLLRKINRDEYEILPISKSQIHLTNYLGDPLW